MAALVFGALPYSTSPSRLVFGGSGGEAPPPPPPIDVTLTATLPSPQLAMTTVYDNRVTRWRDARTHAAHQVAQPLEIVRGARFGQSSGLRMGIDAAQQVALAIDAHSRIAWLKPVAKSNVAAAAWEHANPLGAKAALPHQTAVALGASAAGAWQLAGALGVRAAVVTEVAARLGYRLDSGWQVAAQHRASYASLFHAFAKRLALAEAIVWQLARKAPNGKEQWPRPALPLPQYTPVSQLVFQCSPITSGPWVLLFGDKPCYLAVDGSQFAILPARFYMTINTVQAELLPSLAEVPLYSGCTISQDVGSYGWTLSATGPAAIHAQLAPAPGVPKQLRVTINGIVWVFAIDNPRKSQIFGKTVTQITGRSVTAAVGPAFARETARLATDPYNAQQLAAQALENTGITLDWGVDDWLVPAGAWSHYGTPLAAVQAIAQAAGGYVQSHRSLPELQVRHPYPLLPGGILGGPWNWGGAFAADVNLAPDAIVSRSTEVRDSPALNAVYVSGTTQGVLALIKREGTAGELLGAQINDALVTANVAARQRGLAVLGAAGGRVMHQLELPVLVGVGQPGVLSTDQLIQVNDAVPWRGRVRAVSVTGGRPSVRQTVLVEAA
jgi:hypothetical protein